MILDPLGYWASWADTLPVLQRQLPDVAAAAVAQLRPLPGRIGSRRGSMPRPGREDLLQEAPPRAVPLAAPVLEPSARGWQAPAAAALAERLQADFVSRLDVASKALLHSQTGPFSSRPFTPTCPDELSFPYLRALFLRRLRLPLPLSARKGRRPLDPLGDHRAACARSGALRSHGCPLERAAARVCREAGARVTTNNARA